MSRARETVPFSAIEKIDTRRRTSTATVVVIGPQGRLDEAGEALDELADSIDLRVVLISQAGGSSSSITVSKHAVEFDSLEPDFVNNAVAALRLPNLPTFVWWRGGDRSSVPGLATLADRIVLDEEDPLPLWGQLRDLVEHAPVTDLRWTRLTRWRALMAHFFDMPQVRDRASAFRRLAITGADKPSAQLFAGWLSSSLEWKEDGAWTFTASGKAPIESVTLGDGGEKNAELRTSNAELRTSNAELRTSNAELRTSNAELRTSNAELRTSNDELRTSNDEQKNSKFNVQHSTFALNLSLGPTGCVESCALVEGDRRFSRIVSLGDQRLGRLMAEELKIRSRDTAFERAMEHAARFA